MDSFDEPSRANLLSPPGLGFAGLTWYQGEANTGPDNPQPLNWGTGPTGVSASPV